MGERVPPTDANISIAPPAPKIQGIDNADQRRATDFLLDSCRIGNVRTRYDKYRRYVQLNCQEIFDSLVNLYESILRSQWNHFRRMIEPTPISPSVNYIRLTAQVYISHWFIDLYCSIREATRAISPIAFNEKFSTEVVPFSNEYDPFLAHLLGAIRPTHVQLTPEDMLCIPTFSGDLDFKGLDTADANPFNIVNFKLYHDVFYGILMIMKERKEWKVATVPSGTIGRPSWLFDWHEDAQACAWFPRERNYNDGDVTVAYILGVACTPKLGSRDIDDWQYPTDLTMPDPKLIHTLKRVNDRRFHGSYEVRTIDQEPDFILPDVVIDSLDYLFPDTTKKRKISKGKGPATATTSALVPTQTSSDTTQVIIPTYPRFRIIDWCYYARVVLNIEWHTRTGALRIFVLN